MPKGALGLARVSRDPRTWIAAGFFAALAVGSNWGLPGSDSWAADSISPRSCGLGAIVETYWPGHFHTYPPLHMMFLSLLSLPWMALAASRVGMSTTALGAELIKPFYMTAIEVSARLVAAAMAGCTLWNFGRLWSRVAGARAGVLAALLLASNAVFVYYAHTGNLDVPYLFWISWALLEMDRVVCGEPREGRVLLFSAAAVLTKDQAAAALLLPLPISLLILPWTRKRTPPWRRNLIGGALIAAGTYALASGALVNPEGFRLRVAFLLGPASQSWAGYPRGIGGSIALIRDAVLAIPHVTSWPVAVASAAGILLVIAARSGTGGIDRGRASLPLCAAVSFTLFFSLSARRSEDRFLLPQSLFLLPYAALAFDRAWMSFPAWRILLGAIGVVSLIPAWMGVVSMDASLLCDPRYEAERFLKALPARTRVEVYGGPIFLPRVPSDLVAVRPGVEPIADRQAIAGVSDLVDPAMDPRARRPDVIVLATELSHVEATLAPGSSRRFSLAQYGDATSHALFRGLLDGSLGYSRALTAECRLPWPLECRRIHGSTAGSVWIYAHAPPSGG